MKSFRRHGSSPFDSHHRFYHQFCKKKINKDVKHKLKKKNLISEIFLCRLHTLSQFQLIELILLLNFFELAFQIHTIIVFYKYNLK